MNTAQLKEQVKNLPAGSGIYLFKNDKNKPIYIGKALNLKNRLSNYLKTSDDRIQKMIMEAKKLDFILTESDIEALILESQYIKKYMPDFNIMLRDDKQYGFVAFTQEKYPKIFITHHPMSDEDFIGPFTEIGALKTTLRLLRKIFPYCTCTQTHHNYCLNYHIGKCPGFCCLKKPETNDEQLKTYDKNIKAIKDILSGKKSSLIKNLEKEMKSLSDKQEYEKARNLQYKIEKLKRVFENAQIIQRQTTDNTETLIELKKILKISDLPVRIEAFDIANIQGKHAVGGMSVFSNGVPDKNQYRKFKIYTKNTADDTGMLKEVLTRRFRHPEWPMPDLILIDGGKGQLNTALQVLQDTKYKIQDTKIIALTKNEHHIGYKITLKNKEILLSKLSISLKNFLIQIDSEAHRFSISYYRKLHRKSL